MVPRLPRTPFPSVSITEVVYAFFLQNSEEELAQLPKQTSAHTSQEGLVHGYYQCLQWFPNTILGRLFKMRFLLPENHQEKRKKE